MPTRGHVYLYGKEAYGPPENLGMVFQRDLLLEWRTAIDNVLMPLEIRGESVKSHRERALWLLEMVGLSAFVDAYPWQLSGGMLQRASLCRALIHDPQILLLDEPFGALDAFTREELWDTLKTLWQEQKFTVLLVTHDLAEAVYLADTVHVFSNRPGRVLYSCNVEFAAPKNVDIRFSKEFVDYVHELRARIRVERAVL